MLLQAALVDAPTAALAAVCWQVVEGTPLPIWIPVPFWGWVPIPFFGLMEWILLAAFTMAWCAAKSALPHQNVSTATADSCPLAHPMMQVHRAVL